MLKWTTGFLAVCIAVLGVQGVAAAADDLDALYLDESMAKLGRGVANIFTCPGEIIREVEVTGRDKGYLAALTAGTAKGVGRTVLRAGAGITDVLTFYSRWPNDRQPLIEPEYIYAHGEFDQSQQ